MNLNIRKAILHNLQNNDQEQLEATVASAIQNGEEKTLPGLGVLFELIWNHSETMDKKEMIDALEQGVKEQTGSM